MPAPYDIGHTVLTPLLLNSFSQRKKPIARHRSVCLSRHYTRPAPSCQQNFRKYSCTYFITFKKRNQVHFQPNYYVFRCIFKTSIKEHKSIQQINQKTKNQFGYYFPLWRPNRFLHSIGFIPVDSMNTFLKCLGSEKKRISDIFFTG